MTEQEYKDAISKIDAAILTVVESGKKYTLSLGSAGSQDIEVTRASLSELRSLKEQYRSELRDLQAERDTGGGGIFYAR